MEKSYKFRAYPNKMQEDLIRKTFGCSRFVYNYYLAKRIELYQNSKKSMTYNQCSADLTLLKRNMEWLKDVDKFALQNSLRDLDRAYQKFFRSNSGFPKFKSKKTHGYSYRTNFNKTTSGGNIMFENNHIKLPKLGWVKVRDKQVPHGRILNATISQESSGKYYISLCCEYIDIVPLKKSGKAVGIDLGIKDFCIMSNGIKIENPKFLKKSSNKLVQLKRELLRKTSGSNRYNKARIKVAKQHEKVANQRKDFLQKLSTKLVHEYDIICMEELQVENMLKNHRLARSISDASWYEFMRQVQYKGEWFDRNVVKIDRFFPSSQTCNCCGFINDKTKNLSVREWDCDNCGATHDRDINAAINILNEGLRLLRLA